jgi:predicted DNA-binding protein
MSTTEIIRHAGGRPPKNTKQISLRLNRFVLQKLESLAAERGMSKSEYVELLLNRKTRP